MIIMIKMVNELNVYEDIPGNNPCSFCRNLYKEMYDGRMDIVVTDSGVQPVGSTRIAAPLTDVQFMQII
jgi:cytidine deaminase